MNTLSIKSWAVARSIYKGCTALSLSFDNAFFMRPKLISGGLISFGDKHDLVFSKKNILNLQKNKFALPQIRFLIMHPQSGFKKIKMLNTIGKYIRSKQSTPDYLAVLMALSLEATTVYINNHSKCVDIMGKEEGILTFSLKEPQLSLMSLDRNKQNQWFCKSGKSEIEPRVKLIFNDSSIGIKSCLGKINPLVGAALGQYEVHGYLPLMEKVGYCARLVGKDLPLMT